MNSDNSSNQNSSKQDDTPLRPAMAKLVAAIAEKRRKLGFAEWGPLSIEEVVEKISEKPDLKPTNTAHNPKQQDNIKATIFQPPEVDDGDLPPLL